MDEYRMIKTFKSQFLLITLHFSKYFLFRASFAVLISTTLLQGCINDNVRTAAPVEKREIAVSLKKPRFTSASHPSFSQSADSGYAKGASYEYSGARTFAIKPLGQGTAYASVGSSTSAFSSTNVSAPTTSLNKETSSPLSSEAPLSKPINIESVSPTSTGAERAIEYSQSPAFHLVSQGETLYSISRKYHLAVDETASLNKISPPYSISVGQKLIVSKNTPQNSFESAKEVSQVALAPQANKFLDITEKNDEKEIQQTNSNQKSKRFSIEWLWPIQGSIIRKFSVDGNKGIDISGATGEPVYSAANGKVMYSGNGLRGYGNMIIVQHDQGYLTAYAHNSKLLVSEGSFVKAGQKIAEIGSTEAEISKLHFEIRKNGNPVDPVAYLPER